ncbi:hypothetical protein BDK51DRAFT_47783 [Blyttiomyces helicus]|uniref:Uncharacterized protein n=1 Tax=Blyttiomyces helicus TaxID=388810 RepID=A0A4V1IQ82_9FUNG|nr:hypothetical protein BDK51DRAFT_47783 [Blyttiomyces helicus]|eukprot:RKO85647.1 hypothetical protein BDK51DRAFT_47783 [Blyttiomyces helicus]
MSHPRKRRNSASAPIPHKKQQQLPSTSLAAYFEQGPGPDLDNSFNGILLAHAARLLAGVPAGTTDPFRSLRVLPLLPSLLHSSCIFLVLPYLLRSGQTPKFCLLNLAGEVKNIDDSLLTETDKRRLVKETRDARDAIDLAALQAPLPDPSNPSPSSASSSASSSVSTAYEPLRHIIYRGPDNANRAFHACRPEKGGEALLLLFSRVKFFRDKSCVGDRPNLVRFVGNVSVAHLAERAVPSEGNSYEFDHITGGWHVQILGAKQLDTLVEHEIANKSTQDQIDPEIEIADDEMETETETEKVDSRNVHESGEIKSGAERAAHLRRSQRKARAHVDAADKVEGDHVVKSARTSSSALGVSGTSQADLRRKAPSKRPATSLEEQQPPAKIARSKRSGRRRAGSSSTTTTSASVDPAVAAINAWRALGPTDRDRVLATIASEKLAGAAAITIEGEHTALPQPSASLRRPSIVASARTRSKKGPMSILAEDDSSDDGTHTERMSEATALAAKTKKLTGRRNASGGAQHDAATCNRKWTFADCKRGIVVERFEVNNSDMSGSWELYFNSDNERIFIADRHDPSRHITFSEQEMSQMEAKPEREHARSVHYEGTRRLLDYAPHPYSPVPALAFGRDNPTQGADPRLRAKAVQPPPAKEAQRPLANEVEPPPATQEKAAPSRFRAYSEVRFPGGVVRRL